MAVSDPTSSVPTPTGTLQGAAAFSWDGVTWQPAGAAYASVGTPTGVLRGVAPFSYSGGVWTPAGHAQPGVPTPTGTLDGVAVYTWSGSAWTPAGGAPDVPTPSGTLQGVAAFYFDGVAWQPTGQAAPEVATPSGVLAGMAMFSWAGTGWAPTVSPASLDLNFTTMAPTLDPRITFARASTATYFDATGTMQTAAANVPRFDYDPVTHASLGLLIEDTRTNVLLNSAALGTQSVTTTATAYTLSFYGTGSITLSGTASGTTNGIGAFPARVSTTFTPTAGALTLTVSGSIINAQLEASAFATTYIPTAGATATRAAETATMSLGTWFNAAAFSLVAEGATVSTLASNVSFLSLSDNSASNLVLLYENSLTPSTAVFAAGTNLFTTIGPTISASALDKIGISMLSGNSRAASNGTAMTVSGGSLGAAFNLSAVNRLDLGYQAPFGNQLDGWLRRVRCWPQALSAAQLQQVTT